MAHHSCHNIRSRLHHGICHVYQQLLLSQADKSVGHDVFDNNSADDNYTSYNQNQMNDDHNVVAANIWDMNRICESNCGVGCIWSDYQNTTYVC